MPKRKLDPTIMWAVVTTTATKIRFNDLVGSEREARGTAKTWNDAARERGHAVRWKPVRVRVEPMDE